MNSLSPNATLCHPSTVTHPETAARPPPGAGERNIAPCNPMSPPTRVCVVSDQCRTTALCARLAPMATGNVAKSAHTTATVAAHLTAARRRPSNLRTGLSRDERLTPEPAPDLSPVRRPRSSAPPMPCRQNPTFTRDAPAALPTGQPLALPAPRVLTTGQPLALPTPRPLPTGQPVTLDTSLTTC